MYDLNLHVSWNIGIVGLWYILNFSSAWLCFCAFENFEFWTFTEYLSLLTQDQLEISNATSPEMAFQLLQTSSE